MYFTDKKIATQLVELEISNREYILTLIDDIVEVVKKFDGKVFNKRIETALQKAIENNSHYKTGTHIYCLYEYDIFHMKLCVPDRRVHNLENWYFIENNTLDICFLDAEIAIVDKRIVAEAIIKDIRNQKQEIQERIIELKQGLLRVDEWEKRWREVESQITKLQKEIPHEIQRYFRMKFDLRQY